MSSLHKNFMLRCLYLAQKGRHSVSPNPMVGAVVVKNGRIIGEGYHRKSGEPHAEVIAIESVKNPNLLPGSTIYVSLEPCAHYGKTPPCTNLIIEKKISRVVIAATDPNEKVCGMGIAQLRNAGIEVITGILEKEAIELNRRFFINQRDKRPYVILKWAETSDGFIDRLRKDSSTPPLKITSTFLQKVVHKWRSEEDAILVGRKTAELDNPSLTVRHWPGTSPTRIIIDPGLELSNNLNVFDKSVRTIIFNSVKEESLDNLHYVKISFDKNIIRTMLNTLFKFGIMSILVEGGSSTINHFLKSELWDEIRILKSPMRIGLGIKAPEVSISNFKMKRIGDEIIYTLNKKPSLIQTP